MMPTERAKNFKGSLRRLAGYLSPHRAQVAVVMVMALVSVTLSIAGPKILGRATNLLFEGVIGKQLPPGLTKEAIIAMLKAVGKDRMADMVSGMNIVPGRGVDFAAIGRVLLTLGGVYLVSALFGWMQHYIMAGVSQRTVYGLRKEADAKLARLPLKYYDGNTRGEILSRLTNDIDNIASSLQQSLNQLTTAAFTVVGVLIMMFSISPLLAAIALATLPLSVVVTLMIAKRSQKQFAAQWESTGALNSHIEEMYTGHNIVKVFNRQQTAVDAFDKENERLFQAGFKAHFISSTIQPGMQFINNLNYVAVCVIGGMKVASGALSLGDVQAFIQYSRQFTQPIVQTASIMNILQSTVASAERVFELPEESRQGRGIALVNIINLEPDETVTALLSVPDFKQANYCTMATRRGRVKRIALAEFANVRPSGLIAIKLDEGDSLGWVCLTSGKDEIMLITRGGKALRFSEEEIRPTGRTTMGVTGIHLRAEDALAAMAVVEPGGYLLVLTEKGHGKRTPLDEYMPKSRATLGVATINPTALARIGSIAEALVVQESDEITLISSAGIVLRMKAANVSVQGRATQGVKVMVLDEGDTLAAVARIPGGDILTSGLPDSQAEISAE